MFGDDHNPPHFHVRYGDYEAIITIQDGIVKGELPKRYLKTYSSGWRFIKTNLK